MNIDNSVNQVCLRLSYHTVPIIQNIEPQYLFNHKKLLLTE